MRFCQLASHLRANCWTFVVAALLTLLPQIAQGQGFVWVRQFGTNRDDQVNAVAASPSGVYVGGNTIGVFPGQSAVLNDVDAFVARYDVAGNQLWVREFGSTTFADDSVHGVAADSTGVYAVGETLGTLPGQSRIGSSDIFVRKYDVNGTELWTRQFGTADEDFGTAVAVDATGVYVAGTLVGDGVVRKYDLSGNELWTRPVATGSTDEVRGIAADPSGIYVTGRTNGEFVAPGLGSFDVFLRKYDKDGNVIWTRQFGTDSTDQGNAVAVDSTGVYVAGDTVGAFAGQSKVGGLWDVFAAKYDLNGNQQWARQFGTHFEDLAYGVAVSSTGAYFVGFNDGEALPGTTAQGGFDAWVRVYDANGNVLSTRQFGTSDSDAAYGVAADSTGVYIGGQAGFVAAFPGQTTSGGYDGFIARIPPPPDVSVGGVVNNASFAASPVPVAPGSIAAVFGANLNNGSAVQFSSYGLDGKLVTSLGGASATINSIPAPMFYSFPSQLGVQVPFELAGQTTGTIVVTVAGQSSVPRTINLDALAPGIFTANQQGSGIAAVLHQDGITPVTVQNPAHPNEVVVFFTTGLGAVTPALATGAPSILNRTVTNPVVTIDGASVAPDFSGAAPGFVGLNQINARVPAGTRTGTNIPVLVTIGGKQSNSATIPVGP